MISGRAALAQLEQAIAGARDDESRLDAALASATAEAERLRGEQAEAFRALARIRLDTLGGEKVHGDIAAVERDALAVLAEKRRTLQEIGERRTRTGRDLAAGEAKRQDAAGRLEEVLHRIEVLTEATRARIAGDADWAKAQAAAAEAQATADRATAKAKQAAADRATKGAPFEADRLFMYLWANGYGTSRYAAGPFVKFFDAKVARLCGFIEARPNYAMLTEIPERLAAHAARLGEDLKTVIAARTRIERVALEADGIAALEAEFATIKAEIDAGNQGLASLQRDLAALDANHGALVSGEAPEVIAALDRVAAALADKDLQTLYAQAFATPTPDDEAIVRRIEEIGKAVAKAEREIAETRATIREAARRRAEIEDARDRFRRSGYDRPGVSFGNEQLLGNVIGGIIGGVLSSPDLWNVLLGGVHDRRRSSGDIFGGGPNLPGGGWLGGGGDGGSSGGFGGGGGFSTGGGFGGDNSSSGGGF